MYHWRSQHINLVGTDWFGFSILSSVFPLHCSILFHRKLNKFHTWQPINWEHLLCVRYEYSISMWPFINWHVWATYRTTILILPISKRSAILIVANFTFNNKLLNENQLKISSLTIKSDEIKLDSSIAIFDLKIESCCLKINRTYALTSSNNTFNKNSEK